MPLLTGLLLVLLAGLLQGTFILPMTLVKQWSWEHTWATFSLLGMFLFNWIITLVLIPNIFAVYGASPSRDLAILALFGMGWGVGAVLFGMGMDRLGMALGYPIIMGLIASLGALIPLLVFFPQTLLTTKGLVLLAGTALVIFGIVLCSIGGSRKTPVRENSATTPSYSATSMHTMFLSPAARSSSARQYGNALMTALMPYGPAVIYGRPCRWQIWKL